MQASTIQVLPSSWFGIREGDGMRALIASFLFSVFCHSSCEARDTITPYRGLRDGETIVSVGGKFALGFFSPPRSSNRYFGIWFTSESENPVPVIWVANRETPVTDASGSVSINENGSFVLIDGRKNPLWSTPAPSNASRNSTARILDTGNLVLLDAKTGDSIWESFDQPDHALLPYMRVGVDVNTNRKRFMHSWKDVSDPSVGKFTLGLNPLKPYEGLMWKNSELYWRSGPWNGRAFLGIPGMSTFYIAGFSITDGGGSVDFNTDAYNLSDSGQYVFLLNSTGNFVQLNWDAKKKIWFTYWTLLVSECDFYGKCGASGVCNRLASPICSCMRGYEPRFREEWNKGNWSGGCVRRTPMGCEVSERRSAEMKEDGFLKLQNMKPPDSIARLSFGYQYAKGCEGACLRNCSCVAYAYDAGIGCMYWEEELMDLQKFHLDGVDLYIRLPASELGDKKPVKVIVAVIVLGTSVMCVFVFLMWRWLAKKKEPEATERSVERLVDSVPVGLKQDKGPELQIFDFKVVSTATENFSPANKLGGGGFGPVYKGRLPTGQEIAVKRLSKNSGQGLLEFRNEVVVISRVQHKNLVRLLGYCVQGEEMMLVYEYMPNKSLDSFIFDSDDQQRLDWAQRFHIIEGIARGLLYLHRDSRLKIIHRDLKASNVLLDRDLNPKISDFGLARIFGGNQIQDMTRRVVGTYGYMSPEYAMQGQFSEKSDVFSFGVLLLEIVSGKKNTDFYNQEDSLYLLGHVWKLWNEGKALELIDPKLGSTYSETEVLRCIHVGLLCVQELAADRPSTSTTTLFLSTDTPITSTPKQPAYLLTSTTAQSKSSEGNASINDVTVTKLEVR